MEQTIDGSHHIILIRPRSVNIEEIVGCAHNTLWGLTINWSSNFLYMAYKIVDYFKVI